MRARNGGTRASLTTAVVVLLVGCGGAGETPPITITESGASNPTVAVDARSGTAYVAWVENGGHASDVWLAAVDPDGAVAPAVRVNDVPGDAAPHLQAPAQVAVGPEGHVYVAWTNNTVIEGRRFPASDLRFARSVDGGRTFEPALTVNDDADGPPTSHTFHDVLVGDDGTVVVSWLDNRREVSSDGGRGGGGGDSEGRDGEGRDGEGASSGVDVPGPDVRIAISTDGGRSFSESRVANRHTCPCCRTSLAVGADGELFVAWRKIFEGDIRDVVVARSDDQGVTWRDPVRVAADDWVFPGCPHAGPSVAVDETGVLHVGWYTGREGAPGLFYARSDDGGRSFSPATPLLVDEWVPPSQVRIDVAGEDVVRLAWEDRRRDQPGFLYSEIGSGEAAPGHSLFTPGTNPAMSSGAGRHATAWLDGDRVLLKLSGARP